MSCSADRAGYNGKNRAAIGDLFGRLGCPSNPQTAFSRLSRVLLTFFT
jgi:hypothetical protein